MEYLQTGKNFLLEAGGGLPSLQIAYNTYGQLNDSKTNVIWVCHALTANSDLLAWWEKLVGDGRLFDTRKYFIVCANILGSCYGTTGPLSLNPSTGKQYLADFPKLTIRDIVRAHILLCDHLGIVSIELLAGGSMGGYQVLEWAVMQPLRIKKLFLIATSARETAWGVAIHTAQRMAIETDPLWGRPQENAGAAGLKVARAIGMLTYRGYETFQTTQLDQDNELLSGFRADAYIRYQGEKLSKRFNAYSYHLLTQAMDTHNLARSRTQLLEQALGLVKQPSFIMGIQSDILCPVAEQQFLARNMENADIKIIDSVYGHDGFLVETEAITRWAGSWMRNISL